MADQLQAEATEALEDLRDLARGIYPPLLADKGLGAALEAQARKAALPVRVESDGISRYPQDVDQAPLSFTGGRGRTLSTGPTSTDTIVRLSVPPSVR